MKICPISQNLQTNYCAAKKQNPSFKAGASIQNTAITAGTVASFSIISFLKGLFKSDNSAEKEQKEIPEVDFHPDYQTDLDMIEYNARVYG